MAAIDKARKRLADRLEPGEDLVDAGQIMVPGSMTSFATAGVAGVVGMLGSMALEGLGGRSTPTAEELAESKRIDLQDVNLGQLAFSSRRMFVVPISAKKGEIVELPLAGARVGWEEHGKVSLRVGHYLVAAADGRWFLGEVQAGLRKKGSAADFTENLAAAVDPRVDREGATPRAPSPCRRRCRATRAKGPPASRRCARRAGRRRAPSPSP